MKRILVNVDHCSGCRRCEVLCAFVHENQFRPSAARINVVKEDIWGFDLPVLCNHCEDCAIVNDCPAEALYRNANGLITVDEEKCSGCGKCARTCPLHAIRLHPDRLTPLLCDLCSGKPLCAEKCPTKALIYADTEAPKLQPPEKVMKNTLKRWRMSA